MRLNELTQVRGRKVVLVPYKKEHVPKYHEWMQSDELRQLTASEPLTLVQEYQMQQTWLHSQDKLTFIVLDSTLFDQQQNEISAMIGDTNIFLNEDDDGNVIGEVEIMIAEKWARGQKRGWEATLLILHYACINLPVKWFEAKIGFSNEVSIKMFQKIGFQETSRSEVFGEVTLRKEADSDFKKWLSAQTQGPVFEQIKPD